MPQLPPEGALGWETELWDVAGVAAERALSWVRTWARCSLDVAVAWGTCRGGHGKRQEFSSSREKREKENKRDRVQGQQGEQRERGRDRDSWRVQQGGTVFET